MSYQIKRVASHNTHWHHWSCNTCKTRLPSLNNNNWNIMEDILLVQEQATGSDLTDDQIKHATRIYFWSNFLTSLDFITQECALSAMWVFQRQVPSLQGALALCAETQARPWDPSRQPWCVWKPTKPITRKWKTSLYPLAEQHITWKKC